MVLTATACGEKNSPPRSEAKAESDFRSAASPSLEKPLPVTSPLQGCGEVPRAGKKLAWLPGSLPLPEGSRHVRDLSTQKMRKEGVIAVPVSLIDWADFADKSLPEAGWRVVGGDAEVGEVDRGFRKGRQTGLFRAQSPYCDLEWSELKVQYGQTGPRCPGSDDLCGYKFEGFLPPISMTEINRVKAGSEIVFRWRLKGPDGQPVTDLGVFVAGYFSPPNLGSSSSLKYGVDAFELRVFTVEKWAGSTKVFTLELDDGTIYKGKFRFT